MGSAPSESDWNYYARRCSYRPFDFRWVYLHKGVCDRPRLEITSDLFNSNMGLNLVRQTRATHWRHAFVSRLPTPAVFLEIKDGSSIFPLYAYHDPTEKKRAEEGPLYVPFLPWPPGTQDRRPNFNLSFIRELEHHAALKFLPDGKGDVHNAFGPEDVLSYVYAVFHSATYRARYTTFLKRDFPRIPTTSDPNLFRTLCERGAELVALHVMESPALESLITSYPVKASNIIEKGYPKYVAPQGSKPPQPGRVYINKDQYFEGVAPEVWDFHIGGYQVCEKWLKDRRGRELSYDDTNHYQKIIVALKETIRLIAEIDAAIPQWPIE